MIEVEGKQVFTELEELVDPAHSALLVVDMQRDFCEPGVAFDRLGVDISMYPPMIPRIARLIEGCSGREGADRLSPDDGTARSGERIAGPDPLQPAAASGRATAMSNR